MSLPKSSAATMEEVKAKEEERRARKKANDKASKERRKAMRQKKDRARKKEEEEEERAAREAEASAESRCVRAASWADLHRLSWRRTSALQRLTRMVKRGEREAADQILAQVLATPRLLGSRIKPSALAQVALATADHSRLSDGSEEGQPVSKMLKAKLYVEARLEKPIDWTAAFHHEDKTY